MKWFWIVLIIGLIIIFGVVAYKRGITIGGLTIGGESKSERKSLKIPSCGECEKESNLITEDEKTMISNLFDVNGIGTGVLNTNQLGILINMKQPNLNTENRIKAILGDRPYQINYGEVTALT